MKTTKSSHFGDCGVPTSSVKNVVRLISWEGSGFWLSGTLRKRVGPGSLENEADFLARVLTIYSGIWIQGRVGLKDCTTINHQFIRCVLDTQKSEAGVKGFTQAKSEVLLGDVKHRLV